MESRSGYILVGGKSSRFGRDKALLEIDKRPLALRLAGVVREATGNVTLVGAAAKYEHLGLRVIPDPLEGFGPLAGVLAALEDSQAARNLIIACDMPFLTAEFIGFLCSEAERTAADVLLPVSPEGIPEPLCAVYSASCRAVIRGEVERGIQKVTRALEKLNVRRLRPSDYAGLDGQGKVFTNINTLEDWQAAQSARG